MKKALIATGLTTLALILSGCNLKLGNKKDKYTIMVYMCGSNLESGYDGYSVDPNSAGLASLDIYEMCTVYDKPKDVNIIIETGGSKAWQNFKIDETKLGRWHIENRVLVKDDELKNASMGKSKTFQDFLEWGLTEYPAEKTAVIMWNHGGAMQGVCSDENYNGDMLTNYEVTTALKNAFNNTGRTEKLEWIGYDACLMQVQDIAEANSDYFNYMVGAQESEAGTGWEYNSWVDDVYKGESTEKILTEICDSFVESYYGGPNNQTLSALNLNKMSAYKEAMESLATSIKSTVGVAFKDDFQTTLKKCQTYGTTYYNAFDLQNAGLSLNPSASNYFGKYGIVEEGESYIDYGYNSFGVLDVIDVLDKLEAKYPTLTNQISKVRTAYNAMLVHNKVGYAAGNSNGLSLFFPLHTRCSSGTYYNANQTRFTNWRDLTRTLGEN